jgi:putative glycosyltransferase (TIGR04348 family)
MNIRFLIPATETVRNGNVATGARWRTFFEKLGHRVISSASGEEPYELLVVFNAYKHRQAIIDARKRGIAARIVICLTGTDLYRELKDDPGAANVLYLADQLVVLQPLAFSELPPALHGKTMVIYQSAVAPPVAPVKAPESFGICVIAHLREVKDPLRTAMAARLLPPESKIRVILVGKALSDGLAAAAAQEAAENPRFRWIGEQPRERTAEILIRSRVLVLSSLLEGGANVVSEAVVSGVPVIATDIPCMRGLLGHDYPGLFPVMDTGSLAGLLLRAESDQKFYAELADRCWRESYKFDPALEEESLKMLIDRVSVRSAAK